MRVPRTSRPIASLLLFLTLLNVACSSWSPVTLPAPADTNWSIHHRMRVTDSAGTRFIGTSASVRDSFLVVVGREGVDQWIPLRQITRVDQGHANVLGTIAVVWIAVSAVATVIMIANPPKPVPAGPPSDCGFICF